MPRVATSRAESVGGGLGLALQITGRRIVFVLVWIGRRITNSRIKNEHHWSICVPANRSINEVSHAGDGEYLDDCEDVFMKVSRIK